MNDTNLPSHEDFGKMTWLLMEDVQRSWDALHEATTKEDQDFWKRTFVRAVFAEIEGFNEFFRSQALTAEFNKLISSIQSSMPGQIQFQLNPGLLSVLEGKSYFIADDGEMKSQSMRTPFLANLLFCFNSYAKAHGADVQIKKGDQWSKIQSAVRVRDGLMHPKSPKSLEINEQEIEDVAFISNWFYKQLRSIMQTKITDDNFKDFPEEIFTLKLKKL
jgi:hypothetical protein